LKTGLPAWGWNFGASRLKGSAIFASLSLPSILFLRAAAKNQLSTSASVITEASPYFLP
jgi:hypothetical protein